MLVEQIRCQASIDLLGTSAPRDWFGDKGQKRSREFGRRSPFRLEGPHENVLENREIDDTFLEETPWFADIANYLATRTFPKWLTYQQRKKFFSYLKYNIWEDPYPFRVCSDQVVRRCMSQRERKDILKHYHSGPTMGHYSTNRTIRKILDAGFCWPSMFQDAQEYVLKCDRCQRAGNLSYQD